MTIESNDDFEAGNDYFTNDGERVYLVSRLMDGEGFLVNRYVTVDCYGDEPTTVLSEFPFIAQDLHSTAPAKRASPIAKALASEIAELNAQRNQLMCDVRVLDEKAQDARRDLASYPDFSLAIDFLEGRITHLVRIGHGPPEIVLTPSAVAPTNFYGKTESGPIRLLSITGHYDDKGKRVTKWGVHRYSDGSGSSECHIIPCRSLDEAEGRVRKLFAEAVEKWRAQSVDPKTGRRWGWWTLQAWEKAPVALHWPADVVDEIVAGTKANAHAARVEADKKQADAAKMPTDWAPPQLRITDAA